MKPVVVVGASGPADLFRSPLPSPRFSRKGKDDDADVLISFGFIC